MFFIKKNLGLLLCGLIFLVVVIMLTYRIIFVERKKYDAAVANLLSTENWFKQVNSDGWKILGSKEGNLENAQTARYNKDVAVGHYADIQRQLIENYSFIPQLPNTSSEAQDWLADKVDELTEYVIGQNGVSWFEAEVGGPFVDLANQDKPIMKEDFQAVFRQLMVYEKMVRHIVNAGVKVVDDLDFPRQLATEDAGEYTVTPIVLKVQGDAATLQKLVNNLIKDPSMLFFVRNMQFTAVSEDTPAEEYNAVLLERVDARQAKRNGGRGNEGAATGRPERTSRRSSRAGADEAMMGGPAGGGRSSRSSSRSERASRRSNNAGGEAGIGMGGRAGAGMGESRSAASEADMVYEEPKRRDFVILRTPRQIALELTLDLMEYKPIEEEEAEGAEDGGEDED